jgi:signal transduction histidine kinase
VFVTNALIFELVVRRIPGTVIHLVAMTLFAASLLVAGLIHVRTGLAPLADLRARLGAVSQGRESRVLGSYPGEVQPLVSDLNTLLEDRERRVARAQARAGDLAHGLKTPLAILSLEAQRMASTNPALSTTIGEQVEKMRRQVESHLAHARAAASGATLGTLCVVSESVEGLVRALLHLHSDRALTIEARVPGDLRVRCERQDLDEILGNVLENACQWARSRVSISAAASESVARIHVDDDGPGLDPSLTTRVLERGVRGDTTAPGTGLGLSIVRDLLEAYGGSIALGPAPAGGLRVEIRLRAEVPTP